MTAEKLQQIEQGESFLRGLGLRDCRVRHHGNLARLEIPCERIAEFAQPEVREKVVKRLKEIGFTFVALDLQGFRSGGLNEVLKRMRQREAGSGYEGSGSGFSVKGPAVIGRSIRRTLAATGLVLLLSTALGGHRHCRSERTGRRSRRRRVNLVHVDGTMDGLNTRGPIGYRVFDQP